MGELTGKVAIVTGASKGIGAAIARAFAKAGAAVAVNYASSKADAERVVAEIVKDGGKAVAIQADVAKHGDVQRLFVETREKLGRPSILVNNAGVYRMDPLESVTEEDFHRQFNTNVLGAILAAQEAAKAFNGSGGSIINFSTIWTTNPVPNSLVYSASKSAVDAVTRTLAIELAGKGIRVNAIAPGLVKTDFARALWEPNEEATARMMPLRRLGEPADIGNAAVFLASAAASWITGHTLVVDGGATAGAIAGAPRPGQQRAPGQRTFAGPSFEQRPAG